MSHYDFLTLWELYKSSFHKRISFHATKLMDAITIVDQIMQQHQLLASSNPFFCIPQKNVQIKQNAFQVCGKYCASHPWFSNPMHHEPCLVITFCWWYFVIHILMPQHLFAILNSAPVRHKPWPCYSKTSPNGLKRNCSSLHPHYPITVPIANWSTCASMICNSYLMIPLKRKCLTFLAPAMIITS